MDGDGFSDDEVAAILRRATELDSRPGSAIAGPAWGLPQIEEVGAEVGISADAVRRAAAEMQLSAQENMLDPVEGADRKTVSVVAARVVPLPSDRVIAELRNWLVARGFKIVRERRGATSWRRADVGKAERKALAGVKLRAADAVSLVVASAGDGGSVVRIRVDLPSDRVVRAIRHTRGELWTAGLAGWIGSLVFAHGMFGAGVVIGGGFAGTTFVRRWWSLRSRDRDVKRDVTLEIEGALDLLELGRLGG